MDASNCQSSLHGEAYIEQVVKPMLGRYKNPLDQISVYAEHLSDRANRLSGGVERSYLTEITRITAGWEQAINANRKVDNYAQATLVILTNLARLIPSDMDHWYCLQAKRLIVDVYTRTSPSRPISSPHMLFGGFGGE